MTKSMRLRVQNFNSHSRKTGPIQELATRLDGGQNLGPEKIRPLAGCGKSRFGSKLGGFLVTQNHHPRPISRSWGNCVRFVFRTFLPKRLFPQPARVALLRLLPQSAGHDAARYGAVP